MCGLCSYEVVVVTAQWVMNVDLQWLVAFYSDPVCHVLQGPQRAGGPTFGVIPMPPPDPFSHMQTPNSMPILSPQAFPSVQKTGSFTRLMSRVRRRHRCTQCPRTFTAHASVSRHMKSHHRGQSWHYTLYFPLQ